MTDTGMTICVAGASGLVGSNVVKAALDKGYRVHGTLRNANDTAKAKYLMAFPGAAERLRLFSADTADARSFDAAMTGADAVVIACFPPINKAADGTPAKDLDRVRGYEEIVRPIRDGVLNVLSAAQRAGVGVVVLGSSTSSTNPPVPLEIKTEATAQSDAEHQMAQGKFTAAEKIVMETAALDFCVAHDMRLCVILPTMMLGPVIMPQHLEGDSHALPVGLLQGKRIWHEQTPAGSMSVSHVEDVAALFMAAAENPEARGRYFGVYDSWSWQGLYAEFAKHVPAEALPAPLIGTAEPPTRFDFTRRDSLGVAMRDIPTTIAETFEWLKPGPFPTPNQKEDDMKRTSAAVLGSILLATSAGAQERIAPDAVYQVSPAMGANTDNVLFGQMWERDDLLSKRDRSLITIAALIASGKSAQLSGHIARGLDNGLTPLEISETINQLAYYSGWPNAMSAIDVVKKVFDERGIGPIENSKGERITLNPEAEAARRNTVAETTEPLAPGLAEFTNSALFGDLWLRPDLAPRDRSLATVAALIAMGQSEQLSFHLNYAMDNGLTREQAGEVVSHLAFYAGFPRAYSAVPMLKRIFEARSK